MTAYDASAAPEKLAEILGGAPASLAIAEVSAERAAESGQPSAERAPGAFPYRRIRSRRVVGHPVVVGESVKGAVVVVARPCSDSCGL